MLNPLKILSKFIKSHNQKQLDKLKVILDKVNNFENEISKINDADFPKKTQKLRESLSKDPNIISVGRTKPPSYCQNKHIQINDLDELNKLDSIEFDKVIFLIGSSNHHYININIDMGIDFNVYPLNKALDYFSKKNLKKFMTSKLGK